MSKSHKIIFLTEKPQEVSVLETIQLELYCQTAYKVKLFLSFSTSSLVQKSPPGVDLCVWIQRLESQKWEKYAAFGLSHEWCQK